MELLLLEFLVALCYYIGHKIHIINCHCAVTRGVRMLEKYIQLLLSFSFQSIFIKNLSTIREFTGEKHATSWLFIFCCSETKLRLTQ